MGRARAQVWGTPCVHKAAAGAWLLGARDLFWVVGRSLSVVGDGGTRGTGKIPKVFRGEWFQSMGTRGIGGTGVFAKVIDTSFVVGNKGNRENKEKMKSVRQLSGWKLRFLGTGEQGEQAFPYISLIAVYIDIYNFFFFYIYTLFPLFPYLYIRKRKEI